MKVFSLFTGLNCRALFLLASVCLTGPYAFSDVTFYTSPENQEYAFQPIDPKQAAANNAPLWLRDCELYSQEEQIFLHVNQILTYGKSPFQDYAIVNTDAWGKDLFIDGESQSAQADEYIYHESFVHPAMVAHPNPKSILVIGAGEGAAAREILRYPSVEHLVLVDIDQQVIDAVKTYLPEWHQGSFDNPKTTLVIQDGKEFVATTTEKFDVIYIDICDKLEEDNPVTGLYTSDFYASVKKILSDNGIVVVQAMEISPITTSPDLLIVNNNLKKVFPCVQTYCMYVPSFYAMWGFVVASQTPAVANLTPNTIDSILQERNITQLRHYDGLTHLHMFTLTKTLRNTLQS